MHTVDEKRVIEMLEAGGKKRVTKVKPLDYVCYLSKNRPGYHCNLETWKTWSLKERMDRRRDEFKRNLDDRILKLQREVDTLQGKGSIEELEAILKDEELRIKESWKEVSPSKLFRMEKDGIKPNVDKVPRDYLPCGHYDVTPIWMDHVKIVFEELDKISGVAYEDIAVSYDCNRILDNKKYIVEVVCAKAITEKESNYLCELLKLHPDNSGDLEVIFSDCYIPSSYYKSVVEDEHEEDYEYKDESLKERELELKVRELRQPSKIRETIKAKRDGVICDIQKNAKTVPISPQRVSFANTIKFNEPSNNSARMRDVETTE
jgi:hypothetical protein